MKEFTTKLAGIVLRDNEWNGWMNYLVKISAPKFCWNFHSEINSYFFPFFGYFLNMLNYSKKSTKGKILLYLEAGLQVGLSAFPPNILQS
jgi:hypothetical protein